MVFITSKGQGILCPPWRLETNSKRSLTACPKLGLKLFETCFSTTSIRLSLGQRSSRCNGVLRSTKSESSNGSARLVSQERLGGWLEAEAWGCTTAPLSGNKAFPTGTKGL